MKIRYDFVANIWQYKLFLALSLQHYILGNERKGDRSFA